MYIFANGCPLHRLLTPCHSMCSQVSGVHVNKPITSSKITTTQPKGRSFQWKIWSQMASQSISGGGSQRDRNSSLKPLLATNEAIINMWPQDKTFQSSPAWKNYSNHLSLATVKLRLWSFWSEHPWALTLALPQTQLPECTQQRWIWGWQAVLKCFESTFSTTTSTTDSFSVCGRRNILLWRRATSCPSMLQGTAIWALWQKQCYTRLAGVLPGRSICMKGKCMSAPLYLSTLRAQS